MRKVKTGPKKAAWAVMAATLLLAGCGGGGIMNRDRPDEFAVARSQPLVIPPDFSLTPPKAGDPTPQATDARTQALDALFGGPAPRSRGEQSMLTAAGSDRAALGARSIAGDPNTNVVDKGAVTQTIVNAPVGPGRDATASTPQAGGAPAPAPAPTTPPK
ncbi:MAG: hypothetical protein JWP15_985 [Alphaproteobacteria bacterium]|nr:hypothetical protein [Alphaproteobacteria bacterium]